MDGLDTQEINPHIVTTKEGPLQQELKARGIPCIILPLAWWVTKNNNSFKVFNNFIAELRNSVRPLEKIVNDWNINLVYSNSSVFPVGRLVARRMGIPHIWHIREFGDLDFSLNYIFPRWLCRRFIRASTAVICNSNAVREYYFGTRPYRHVHMIYNGVATRAQFDEFKAIYARRAANPEYTFAIIGSLSARKGQDSAIRALAQLREIGFPVRLIVVGSGREPALANLQALAQELKVAQHIEFTGYIADPYQMYFRSDCLLMCSEHEAFGRVTAEAMSACLPVIGKNSGGTPEIIVHGETGYLYNTFDELVESMTRLVQDPALGRQMGLAGWQRAKQMFNIEDYAANVYRVIQTVTSK